MEHENSVFHAVRLIEEKCRGCVNCIKHCPTEAIRVRRGKAEILDVRCIDCGECIRVCPNHAKTAIADSLERLRDYRVTVALPAPALYGQFDDQIKPEQVLQGLIDLGFDDVFEVAFGADLVSVLVRRELQKPGVIRPMISSACPAVIRLIQVRFPNLVDHIVPVCSPLRIAARLARPEAARRFGVSPEEVGLFFISPCPGKVSAVAEPVGYRTSAVDGAIPICEVYGPLSRAMRDRKAAGQPQARVRSSGSGIGWARAGGENQAVALGRQISVDGVHNVIDIFEDIERGKLSQVDYVEALACTGGCVGGVLTVENPFIARRRIRMLSERPGPEDAPGLEELVEALDDSIFRHDEPISPRSITALADDMEEAIRRVERLERVLETLPGLDCGSCGAPTCQALAEDIVRNEARETDCVFVLRKRVQDLAEELVELSSKLPPAMNHQQVDIASWADGVLRVEEEPAPRS
ncbi:MAG: 4Fe-4S dicluster domain-containing protein [Armatimonadetes bacterium]|nr:4Fe-4S dicluster domain-containing protein [Armatimonadota bacterium]